MERNSFSVRAKLWEKNNKDESSRRKYIYIERVGKGKCKRRSWCCCCKSLKQTLCAIQDKRRMGEREREKVGSNLLWRCPGAVKWVCTWRPTNYQRAKLVVGTCWHLGSFFLPSLILAITFKFVLYFCHPLLWPKFLSFFYNKSFFLSIIIHHFYFIFIE